MFTINDIQIHKVVVHILDTSITMPVLSMAEMPLTLESREFFSSHLVKILNDDGLRKAQRDYNNDDLITTIETLQQDDDRFLSVSQTIAERLFAIMQSNPDIVSGDLSLVDFSTATDRYIALLKMNYQNTYIHFTDYESDMNINTIIQHRTTLPNQGQKISEAATVHLQKMEIKILDKNYDVNGEKKPYLSSLLFQCQTGLSSKEQHNAIKSAAKAVTKKFYDGDPVQTAAVTKQLYNHLDENGKLDLQEFAKETFPTELEASDLFFNTLKKKGVEENVITMAEKTIERGFTKQRIKTDDGIEIKLPMDFYNDPNKMEFKTEPNGKISIIIKDINKIL